MRIIFFVILFISLQIEVYAQQKQLKKSLVGRATLVEVIEAKKTKLYSLIPSYGRIISLEPYSIISKVNEEVKKIYVLEGAEVEKGQKLIELENKNIKRLIARYEAEILYSKDNLEFLNEELAIINDKLKRFLNLKENKVISNDLFDDLRIKKINLNINGKKTKYSFPENSAGPYGNDIIGNWINKKNFSKLMEYKQSGWRDIHASLLDFSENTEEFSKYIKIEKKMEKKAKLIKRFLRLKSKFNFF